MLWRRYGTSTRRWALSPPLLLEGLTNWDLLAVAPATISLLQWEAGNVAFAGALIGLGAIAKLYPAVFIPVLLAACIRDRSWARARTLMLGFLGGVAVVAIPVYAAAPQSFRYFLDFHRVRAPSRGSVWFYVFRNPIDMTLWTAHQVGLVNIAGALALVAALAVLIYRVARGRLDVVAGTALATIAFVLSNKIYSPQYDLWLVPFFVMLPVRSRLVAHFYMASVLNFVLTAAAPNVFTGPFRLQSVGIVVVYRFVVLVRIARQMWWMPADRDLVLDLRVTTPAGSARATRRSTTTY
jgi:uncharacterized membrane protein